MENTEVWPAKLLQENKAVLPSRQVNKGWKQLLIVEFKNTKPKQSW